jgi:hypothetical protein
MNKKETKMSQLSVEVSSDVSIILRISGDLQVEGADALQVQVYSARRGEAALQKDGEKVIVTSHGDADVIVPVNASLQIEHIGGDCAVRNVRGNISMQAVGGDCALLHLGAVDVRAIGGDLTFADLQGALSVSGVGGDTSGGGVQGEVNIRTGGDVSVSGLTGTVSVQAGGDAEVGLNASATVTVVAGGDAEVHLPAGVGVVYTLASGGRDISIETEGGSQSIEKLNAKGQLGIGGPEVKITAGGDVELTDQLMDVEEFEELQADLQEALDEARHDREDGEDEDDEKDEPWITVDTAKISRRVDEAMRRADQRMQQAMRRVEERTHGVIRGSTGVIPPIPPINFSGRGKAAPANPPAAKRGASEEERQMILRMLQEKKITAEQAEQLIEALEGLS